MSPASQVCGVLDECASDSLDSAVDECWAGRKHTYFHGFREQNMLGMFINLYCALSYFAKILESMTENGAGFAPFTTIHYLDYCFTCPLIVLDLLWNVEAPFKWTLTGLVLTCLGVAVASAAAPPPANFAWFGMGIFLFTGTYYMVVTLIMERLSFYIEVARDGNAKQSIKFLKTGCYIFFSVWLIYPLFWLLSGKAANVLSADMEHIITCVMDIFAKSAYGFALLYFRLYFDKKLEQSGIDAEGACVSLYMNACRERNYTSVSVSKPTEGLTCHGTPFADFKKFSENSIYNSQKKKSSYGDSQDYERGYDHRGYPPTTAILTSVYEGKPRHPDDTRNNYDDLEGGDRARGYRGDHAPAPDNLAIKIRKSLDRRGGREARDQLNFAPDLVSPRSPLKHSDSFRTTKSYSLGDTRDQLRAEGPTPPRLELGTVVNSYSSRPSSRAANSHSRHDDAMMPRRNHGSSTRTDSASSRESTPVANDYNRPEYQNTKLFNDGRPGHNYYEGA